MTCLNLSTKNYNWDLKDQTWDLCVTSSHLYPLNSSWISSIISRGTYQIINNSVKTKERLYHRGNVFHLGAVWEWYHMGWSRCPDLCPLQVVSGFWQGCQRSPQVEFLIGSSDHVLSCSGDEKQPTKRDKSTGRA